MLHRCFTVLLALATVATVAEAGPRRRAAVVYQPATQPSLSPLPSSVALPANGVGVTVAPTSFEYISQYTPTATSPSAGIVATDGSSGDGLDEVNAQRVARGLRPFLRDEGLTQAAFACASFRAAHGLFGHTSNDFSFVPPGSWASAAGCAAYPASYGWLSCCVYDNYTYAGAAWVTGRDGKRYMHLFVR
jgi:uncharacterized protein YkwD